MKSMKSIKRGLVRTLARMIALTGVLFAATLPGHAQNRRLYPLPTNAVPDALGVNIHFTDPQPGEMAQLAAAGFRWIRMDFEWAGIEQTKGRYDFAAFDRLMAALKPHRIRPIFILDYGNDLYEKGAPRSPAARAAFVRFVKAGVTHFKNQGVLWEMWNEPNGQFWPPRADVGEYVTLARDVGQAIRAAAPDEWYIGPATSGMDFPFLESCFKAGLLRYWDAVSFHPYRNTPPETAAEDYARLRQSLAHYAPRGKSLPLLSGEWGYSELYPGLNLDRQSKYLARQSLVNLANDLIVSIWYDWRDDGADAKETEHHFGTVYPDYKPKPTYQAARTLAAQLNGFRYNKRLVVGGSDDWCLLFTKGSETRLAVWTADAQGKPHPVTLPVSAGEFDVVSYTGEKTAATADASGLKLTLTDAPQYLAPRGRNALLAGAAVWPSLKPVTLTTGEAFLFPGLSDAMRTRLSQPAFSQFHWRLEDAEGSPLAQAWGLRHGTLDTLNGRVTLTDRSEEGLRVRLRLTANSGPSVVQETRLLPLNPLRVVPLPAAGDRLPVRVENPGGAPFTGWLQNLADQRSVALTFARDEREKIVTLPFTPAPDRNYSAQFALLEDNPGRTPNARAVLTTAKLDFSSYYTMEEDRSPEDPLFTVATDGDPTVGATVSSYFSKPSPGLPTSFPMAMFLEYKLQPGWKFFRVGPNHARSQPLSGRPHALGMWIKGDGSGDALRMRFADATNQTFQPDAGVIDWKGWRYVQFSLSGDNAGRWGGADDGVVHYPIHIDTVFLVDSPGGRGGAGKLEITGMTLIQKRQ